MNLTDKNIFLGIELGSTRIKGLLIDDSGEILASGSFNWENAIEDGYYTYSLEDAVAGVQNVFRQISGSFEKSTGRPLKSVSAIGISGMMHGYLALDKDDNLTTPFRSWRNTNTTAAAMELTKLFNFNIPLRYSVAHLYDSVIKNDSYVNDISFITTLSGYIHYRLTGERVLGVCDASGMFPINCDVCDYNDKMVLSFDEKLSSYGLQFKTRDVFPKVLKAGDCGGRLTAEGARLLDPTGQFEAGAIFCPPEGDAGTGMVATNSVLARTGNVSAGTSIFAMIVLDKELSRVYHEIDIVTTPAGDAVAMVHCNTGTTDLDCWIDMLFEVAIETGSKITKDKLYEIFYNKALMGDTDCGGLINYNFIAAEPIVSVDEGLPMFMRMQNAKLNFANFARAQILSTMSALRLGMDILYSEGLKLELLYGHGGLFKTPIVGQKLLATAVAVPVAVMGTAGEGGAWGIALLALYMTNRLDGESLSDFLARKIFDSSKYSIIKPTDDDILGFDRYLENYKERLEKHLCTKIIRNKKRI